jgi:RimK family alpha-L-glutamate ligase
MTLAPARSDRRSSGSSLGRSCRRALVVGRRSATNAGLCASFASLGFEAAVGPPGAASGPAAGDVVLARLDVLPTLDGVEPGLWQLAGTERAGALLLNRPTALLAAHDKLTTALLLGRSGIPQPRTAHVLDGRLPAEMRPPYVVKPRFGSWGRDVYRCASRAELSHRLARLGRRRWFRLQGALVQELVPPTGSDLRIVVAGGEVVGAIERVAAPGEWRTNISLGGTRRPVSPPDEACLLAVSAVDALGLDLAGVDLLRDPLGRLLVLEVNGAVDFTRDYGADVFERAAAGLLAGRYAATTAA